MDTEAVLEVEREKREMKAPRPNHAKSAHEAAFASSPWSIHVLWAICPCSAQAAPYPDGLCLCKSSDLTQRGRWNELQWLGRMNSIDILGKKALGLSRHFRAKLKALVLTFKVRNKLGQGTFRIALIAINPLVPCAPPQRPC